ncbi:MAG: TIGR01777 family oxidoreductase [Bacteroidales bacterium]
MATILITGGNGIIGKHLCKKLKEKGYDVAILSRNSNPNSNPITYAWNPEKREIDNEAITTADFVIHLAGAKIGEKRWTNERKQLIIDSRVQTAQLIFDKVKENNHKIKAFISASAIGYYGSITSNKIFTETDPSADDFQGECCRKWEEVADKFADSGIRTVKIRTGVVLTKQGGALSKMIIPVKMGIGSALGNGKQYIPWIHIDDLCNIYFKAIEDNQMNGAYNAVAPNHKTNIEFTRLLAKVLKKPFWFPHVPAFLLKILFGNMSEILLKGSRISSDKIKETGYNFLFPNLENALNNLIGKD